MKVERVTGSPVSSIRTLYLNGLAEICFIDRLLILLQHLPNLHSLHIRTKELTAPLTPAVQCTSLLTILTLDTVSFSTPVIASLTSALANLAALTIVCCQPIENVSFLDRQQWLALIDRSPTLRELTIRFRRSNALDERTLQKAEQRLTRSIAGHDVTLRLIETHLK